MNSEHTKPVESRTEEERLTANAKALGDICVYPWNERGMPGVSLRQLYAGMAMQGIFAHGYTMPSESAEAAELAVRAANALLKELAK